VLVTHNQREAKALCDHVALLVDGRIVETGTAAKFFSAPATELGRDFVRLGTCWPTPPEISEEVIDEDTSPELAGPNRTLPKPAPRPGGFHWVLVDRLGGMQRPGLLQPEARDLTGLAMLRCDVLVSLTRQPFDPGKLHALGIRGVHFPIVDMNVPTLAAAAELCREISAWIDASQTTVLHCKAGLGRTGTMLACVLVERGLSAVAAIHEIRSINPLYIQSDCQLAFVRELESYLDGGSDPLDSH
jgi:atypical dual specificity phosphatase